jgi:hypothetical protein
MAHTTAPAQPTDQGMPPASAPAFTRWPRLVLTLRIFACVMFLSGLVFLTIALIFETWHCALAASTFFIIWGQVVAVLCIEALLASRAKYYEHGELAGWYRGYRMLPPQSVNSVLSEGQ